MNISINPNTPTIASMLVTSSIQFIRRESINIEKDTAAMIYTFEDDSKMRIIGAIRKVA